MNNTLGNIHLKYKHTLIASAIMMACTASITANAIETEDDIEKITITGQYLSSSQSHSIKTPTPIIDLPQSLSIITAEDITERGITSIGQIIDYMPGVNTSQGEGHRDSVVFRGVRSTADFFIDGNRDDVQYYRALYNVEQVEILRGPNALLFGRGGTGGIINRVSKKATLDTDFTGYQLNVNTFGGYGAQIDTNVSTSKDSAIRINAMYEQLENHRDFFDGQRVGINPTAHFMLSEDTEVDLSYEYIDHERFIDRGIPTGPDGRPVEALKDVVFADPENNYNSLDAHVFRATIQHHFTDTIKGNVSAFYGDYDKVYANFFTSGYDAATNEATLDGYIDNTQRDNLILSANLVSEFETSGFGHTVILGSEFIQTGSDQNRLNPEFEFINGGRDPDLRGDRETFIANRPLNFNAFSGVNSDGIAVTTAFTDLNDDTRVNLDVFSFFIQDEIEISEHLDIVIGARFDSFDIEVFNAKANDTRTRKDQEISPRAGIIYKPQENISIYASYSESFLPRSGEQFANINGDNNQLDPNTFSTQELGIKWDFAQDISFTAAIFENEQSSPQVADNDPETLDVIDSEISGFEMQLLGYVTDKLEVSVNYSNLDGEIVDRSGPTGRTPREVPQNTFSVWSTYQVSEVFGVGLGATYQDESFIDNGNTASLPSYTRIDASAYYDISDELRIQLNIENLTDTLYFPNAHAQHQVTVAAPINAMLSLVGTL